jgi:hypothetical protein
VSATKRGIKIAPQRQIQLQEKREFWIVDWLMNAAWRKFMNAAPKKAKKRRRRNPAQLSTEQRAIIICQLVICKASSRSNASKVHAGETMARSFFSSRQFLCTIM